MFIFNSALVSVNAEVSGDAQLGGNMKLSGNTRLEGGRWFGSRPPVYELVRRCTAFIQRLKDFSKKA